MNLLERARLIIEEIRAGEYDAVRFGMRMYAETARPDDFPYGLPMGPELDAMDVRIMVYLERNYAAKLSLFGEMEDHHGPGIDWGPLERSLQAATDPMADGG
jgi:hypothetical protein